MTMKMIKTEEALFNWLFAHLLKAQPIIEVTPGLVRSAECIRSAIEDFGYLARYGQDRWHATFDCLLRDVSRPGRARRSVMIIEWLSKICAATIFDRGSALSLKFMILMMIGVSDLEGNHLAITDDGSAVQIRSTALCQRRFGAKICVDLPYAESELDEEDF
jgi:hypothetical protein